MVKVVVTGSSGFIGNRLVAALTQRGYTVMGVDIQRPAVVPERLTFQECNILDGTRLAGIFLEFRPDFVVHLAACVDWDEQRNLKDYSTNIEGVENLVAAVCKTSSIKRCIFTSTQLVCKVGYVPAHNEDYKPSTLYGESKALGEKIVRQSDGGGAEWCIVRPTTVWGPGMKPHYQRFLRMIKLGRYFHVGHKPLYKSYSFVGNIAHQYVQILEAPTERIHRETLYLSDYQPLSLRSWADIIQHNFGAKPIKAYPEMIAKIAAKVGDIINAIGFQSFPFNSFRLNNVLTEYQFDLSKTEGVCGPLPYTVEEGVREMVTWYNSLTFLTDFSIRHCPK